MNKILKVTMLILKSNEELFLKFQVIPLQNMIRVYIHFNKKMD